MSDGPVDDGAELPDTAGRSVAMSTRGAALAAVLAALVVLLSFPLHLLVTQRGQIADLERQRQAQEVALVQLDQQQAQLQDPAYVAMLAQQRLGYVKPGQQLFTVLDPTATATPVPSEARVAPVGSSDHPWWDRVLTSADLAGAAPVVTAAPAASPSAPESPRPIESRSALPTPGPATSAPVAPSPSPSSSR